MHKFILKYALTFIQVAQKKKPNLFLLIAHKQL